MKIRPILEHCDGAICEQSRPAGYGRQAHLFSAAHGGRHGGHVYLGPCACICGDCSRAKDQKVARLDQGHAE